MDTLCKGLGISLISVVINSSFRITFNLNYFLKKYLFIYLDLLYFVAFSFYLIEPALIFLLKLEQF